MSFRRTPDVFLCGRLVVSLNGVLCLTIHHFDVCRNASVFSSVMFAGLLGNRRLSSRPVSIGLYFQLCSGRPLVARMNTCGGDFCCCYCRCFC